MECCGIQMSKFSYYRNAGDTERVRHFCCTKCGSRHHDGINYTADEWFFYINGETRYAYQARLNAEEESRFQSLHAYELVNHHSQEGVPNQ